MERNNMKLKGVVQTDTVHSTPITPLGVTILGWPPHSQGTLHSKRIVLRASIRAVMHYSHNEK